MEIKEQALIRAIGQLYCVFRNRIECFSLLNLFRITPGICMRPAVFIFTVLLAANACAQSAAAPADRAHIRFSFEDAQLEPASYSLEVDEDGSGNYAASYTASSDGDTAAPPVKRAIRIHDPLLSRTFSVARTHHFFAVECELPHSRVAFTGKKTLAYAGPDGNGSCTFNYSKDPTLNQVAVDLMAVAFTLEEGARLANEHRHDRLSLDGELEALQSAVQDQRALEIGNIAPELEAIASDEAVMNRARMRARELLSGANTAH
jgi:hypothetical protein